MGNAMRRCPGHCALWGQPVQHFTVSCSSHWSITIFLFTHCLSDQERRGGGGDGGLEIRITHELTPCIRVMSNRVTTREQTECGVLKFQHCTTSIYSMKNIWQLWCGLTYY